MKTFIIPDEIVLNPKTKKFFGIFCLAGILGTFSLYIPSVQKIFLPFVEKALINYPDTYNNWVSIAALPGLTCFFILFMIIIRKAVNKYEFFIFIFFMIILFGTTSWGANIQNMYVGSPYLLSYRHGFSSRMFIGTIVALLSGTSYISSAFVYIFTLCGTILICFFVSTIIAHIIVKAENKIPIFLLVILYLAAPISPIFYFENGFANMEVYVFLFMLIVFCIVDKNKWRWFIPLLCFMSLATHLVVIFFYMPLVFIILLYEYINRSSQRNNEKYLLITTMAIIALSFLYFVVFSKTMFKFQNYDEVVIFLATKTNITNYDAIYWEHFPSIADTFEYNITKRYAAPGALRMRFYSIIQTLPLFVFFILFWKTCIKTERRKTIKLIFLFSMILPLLSIPAFLLFGDWGRWLVMLLTVQFMLAFYFLYKREHSVVLVSNKLPVIIQKHIFVFALFVMLSVFLGPLQVMQASVNFQRFLDFFINVIKNISSFGGIN